MESFSRSATLDPLPPREIPRIEIDGVVAAYSTGRTANGSWFALGTIAEYGDARIEPALVVVGTGATQDEAVSSLTVEARERALELAAS